MDWYIPITIVPGIGMFVLSTTLQMMGISAEIEILLKENKNNYQHHIANLKIMQLTRLTRASTLLYLASALLVMSGIWKAIYEMNERSEWIIFAAVTCTLTALGILIEYNYDTEKIKRKQHYYKQINHNTGINKNNKKQYYYE